MRLEELPGVFAFDITCSHLQIVMPNVLCSASGHDFPDLFLTAENMLDRTEKSCDAWCTSQHLVLPGNVDWKASQLFHIVGPNITRELQSGMVDVGLFATEDCSTRALTKTHVVSGGKACRNCITEKTHTSKWPSFEFHRHNAQWLSAVATVTAQAKAPTAMIVVEMRMHEIWAGLDTNDNRKAQNNKYYFCLFDQKAWTSLPGAAIGVGDVVVNHLAIRQFRPNWFSKGRKEEILRHPDDESPALKQWKSMYWNTVVLPNARMSKADENYALTRVEVCGMAVKMLSERSPYVVFQDEKTSREAVILHREAPARGRKCMKFLVRFDREGCWKVHLRDVYTNAVFPIGAIQVVRTELLAAYSKRPWSVLSNLFDIIGNLPVSFDRVIKNYMSIVNTIMNWNRKEYLEFRLPIGVGFKVQTGIPLDGALLVKKFMEHSQLFDCVLEEPETYEMRVRFYTELGGVPWLENNELAAVNRMYRGHGFTGFTIARLKYYITVGGYINRMFLNLCKLRGCTLADAQKAMQVDKVQKMVITLAQIRDMARKEAEQYMFMQKQINPGPNSVHEITLRTHSEILLPAVTAESMTVFLSDMLGLYKVSLNIIGQIHANNPKLPYAILVAWHPGMRRDALDTFKMMRAVVDDADADVETVRRRADRLKGYLSVEAVTSYSGRLHMRVNIATKVSAVLAALIHKFARTAMGFCNFMAAFPSTFLRLYGGSFLPRGRDFRITYIRREFPMMNRALGQGLDLVQLNAADTFSHDVHKLVDRLHELYLRREVDSALSQDDRLARAVGTLWFGELKRLKPSFWCKRCKDVTRYHKPTTWGFKRFPLPFTLAEIQKRVHVYSSAYVTSLHNFWLTLTVELKRMLDVPEEAPQFLVHEYWESIKQELRNAQQDRVEGGDAGRRFFKNDWESILADVIASGEKAMASERDVAGSMNYHEQIEKRAILASNTVCARADKSDTIKKLDTVITPHSRKLTLVLEFSFLFQVLWFKILVGVKMWGSQVAAQLCTSKMVEPKKYLHPSILEEDKGKEMYAAIAGTMMIADRTQKAWQDTVVAPTTQLESYHLDNRFGTSWKAIVQVGLKFIAGLWTSAVAFSVIVGIGITGGDYYPMKLTGDPMVNSITDKKDPETGESSVTMDSTLLFFMVEDTSQMATEDVANAVQGQPQGDHFAVEQLDLEFMHGGGIANLMSSMIPDDSTFSQGLESRPMNDRTAKGFSFFLGWSIPLEEWLRLDVKTIVHFYWMSMKANEHVDREEWEQELKKVQKEQKAARG